MHNIDRTFGAIVRNARERLGMSQMEFARKLGCPQSNVSRLERGLRSANLGELVRLAQALNAPLSELLKSLEGGLRIPKDAHSRVAEPSIAYGSFPTFQEAQSSEDAVMAQLAAHGVRFLGTKARPAIFKLSLEETLLAALRFAEEPRLFESLPALVLRHVLKLDWNRLMSGVLLLRLQNRLGMVVAAALELRQDAPDISGEAWAALREVHDKLSEAKLDRKEYLGSKPRTQEAIEYLARRTPGWLRAWHAFGAVDRESLRRHLPR